MISKLFHVLCGALLLLATSCQQSQDSFRSNNTLRLNLSRDPSTFDPRCARSLIDLTLATQLFEGLTRINNQSIPELALAQNVAISEDGLEYTFQLRKAFWSDGSLITAHDFVYAWKKVLDPAFPTDYAQILYVVKNGKRAKIKECSLDEVAISAIDDSTLKVTLEYPTPYFLSLVAFPTTFPIPVGLDEKTPMWMVSKETMIFNGPFKINHWDKQFALLLEKNDTYWDKEHVFLKNINFTVITDATTESYLFEKGELDWLGQPLSHPISSELLYKLKQEGSLLSYDVLGTYMLKFHTQKEPFNDPRLRKAFSYAISRSKIIKHILQGNQQVATALLPPSLALQKNPYFQDEDIDEAKRLFEEVLTEKKLTREKFPKVIVSYVLSERNGKMVQLLQEIWQQTFGIKIELSGTEMQCYFQKLRAGDFYLAMGDWIADFQDPISFLEIFKSNEEKNKTSAVSYTRNHTRWENAIFTNLLEQATFEKDPLIRKKHLHEAEQILMNEMPIAPLYHYSFDYVKKPHIKNAHLSLLGIADFKHVEIEQ